MLEYLNFCLLCTLLTLIFTPGREGFKFDILKCLHLVGLNNLQILMMHDKMAVAVNIGA